MIIELLEDEYGLMLIPESEFEISYLQRINLKEFVARIKTGVSPAEIAGLKLKVKGTIPVISDDKPLPTPPTSGGKPYGVGG
jgi:hypothetical protein